MCVCKDLHWLLIEHFYISNLSFVKHLPESIEYCILHSKHHQTPPTCLAAITSPVPRSAARCDQPVPAPCVSSPRSRETKNTRLWSGLVMSSGKQGTSAAAPSGQTLQGVRKLLCTPVPGFSISLYVSFVKQFVKVYAMKYCPEDNL